MIGMMRRRREESDRELAAMWRARQKARAALPPLERARLEEADWEDAVSGLISTGIVLAVFLVGAICLAVFS